MPVRLRCAALDVFMVVVFLVGVFVYTIPIEMFKENQFIRNVLTPGFLALAVLTFFYMFYDFSTKGRVKRLKAIWFIAFFIFNYLTALVYYFHFYRSRCLK